MNPIHKAIELSKTGLQYGGPFGAVVTRGDEIVGQGFYSVLIKHDPTAHAIVMAIREAARALRTADLSCCELHTNCEPCLMCIGALYWSGITKIFYAATRKDAQDAGFDSNLNGIIVMPSDLLRKGDIEFIQAQEPERIAARLVFEAWDDNLTTL